MPTVDMPYAVARPTIKASIPCLLPPIRAVLERALLQALDAAVYPYLEKYTRPDGSLRWPNRCLADPLNPKHAERARRFAGFYLNEDPDAPNYDPEHNIIRAPHSGRIWRTWFHHSTLRRARKRLPWPSDGAAPTLATTSREIQIDAVDFAMELPPMTEIRLELGMARYINQASYSRPWDREQR